MTPTTLTAHAAIDAFTADAATAPVATRRATSADIAKHLELVHRVVARFARKLPANVDKGDLVAAGMVGLAASLEKNGGDDGVTFTGYALLRIRGAVVDELRSQDWLSRRARAAVAAATGTGPTALVGLDDVGEGERAGALIDRETPDALAALCALGDRQELDTAIAQLPAREATIVARHYFEGVAFKALAAELGVSEPRVSQLHTRALGRLRDVLAQAA